MEVDGQKYVAEASGSSIVRWKGNVYAHLTSNGFTNLTSTSLWGSGTMLVIIERKHHTISLTKKSTVEVPMEGHDDTVEFTVSGEID